MLAFSRILIEIRSASPILTREARLYFSTRSSFRQLPEPQMASIVGNPHDFFSYTSGRWVWDEEEQLRERYRKFDILELQKVAIKSACAGHCIHIEKLGEGLYNKSFRLIIANRKVVIAQIPNPNAGPAFLMTASEVATMDFLRNTLDLPVPKVLAWNSSLDSTNRVGSEYIIMEHALGKNLSDIWTDLDLEHKIQTMEDVVSVQQKLLSVKFSAYGCLFYTRDAPPGSRPATVEGDELSLELKANIADRFSIGPVVDTAFWSKERSDMEIDRGPWLSTVDYIKALALREIAWIQRFATPRSPDDPLFVSQSQNTPAEHISLLQRYLSIAPYLLPREEELLGSFLWHTDLRTPNVFVNNNGNITSIIDWQSIWAGPLFLEGRHPHFLDYNGDMILELPQNFKQLDKTTQTTVRDQVTKSILLYLYEKYTAERNPALSRVFQYPNGMTMADPIRFVGNTWEGDILPLRESLIRLQKKWDSLEYSIKCPLDFSPEEIQKHYEDGEGWNEIQDFWDSLSEIMGRVGWTSHETYDKAKSIYSQILSKGSFAPSHGQET